MRESRPRNGVIDDPSLPPLATGVLVGLCAVKVLLHIWPRREVRYSEDMVALAPLELSWGKGRPSAAEAAFKTEGAIAALKALLHPNTSYRSGKPLPPHHAKTGRAGEFFRSR